MTSATGQLVLNMLRQAAGNEMDTHGYEFCTRAAEQAHHPHTKALFKAVAQDEIGHRQWPQAQEPFRDAMGFVPFYGVMTVSCKSL